MCRSVGYLWYSGYSCHSKFPSQITVLIPFLDSLLILARNSSSMSSNQLILVIQLIMCDVFIEDVFGNSSISLKSLWFCLELYLPFFVVPQWSLSLSWNFKSDTTSFSNCQFSATVTILKFGKKWFNYYMLRENNPGNNVQIAIVKCITEFI